MDNNERMLNRREFVWLGAAIGGAALTSQAWADEAAGVVTDVTGEAMAERARVKRPLAPQGAVYVGDQVGTGSAARASLRLGNSTSLRLGENAKLKIDKYLVGAGGTITLGGGAVLLDRPAEHGQEAMRIRSPYGLIAVRGTEVFAGPSNGVFGVLVVRGSVQVRAAGKTVTLTAGEGTDIPRRGAPPTVPRRWGEKRVQSALASVTK